MAKFDPTKDMRSHSKKGRLANGAPIAPPRKYAIGGFDYGEKIDIAFAYHSHDDVERLKAAEAKRQTKYERKVQRKQARAKTAELESLFDEIAKA